MHVTNHKYRIAQLDRQNLDVASKLLAEVFLKENEIWATISPEPQEVYNFMHAKTSEMLDWEQELRDHGIIKKDIHLNFVCLDEHNQVVGASTNFQLTQYLSKKSQVELPQFNILQKYGHDLEKHIEQEDKVAGKAIYGMFIAVKPELMGSGLSMLFWYDICHFLHGHNFRLCYSRCSNVKSSALMVKNGGELKAKASGIQNGKELNFSFIKWPMNPVHHIQDTVAIYRDRLLKSQ